MPRADERLDSSRAPRNAEWRRAARAGGSRPLPQARAVARTALAILHRLHPRLVRGLRTRSAPRVRQRPCRTCRRAAASIGQERGMFERLNRDRKAQGCRALRFDERLSDVARHHSADMRDHRFFEHESPRTGGVDNRLDAAGYLLPTARENLSEAPDIERSQDGLLKARPHHENIMSEDVTHVGIGIVEGGVVDPRNVAVTQVLARRRRERNAGDGAEPNPRATRPTAGGQEASAGATRRTLDAARTRASRGSSTTGEPGDGRTRRARRIVERSKNTTTRAA